MSACSSAEPRRICGRMTGRITSSPGPAGELDQLGLPVLARLHVPGKSNGPSKVEMAAAVVTLLAFVP